MHQNKMIRKNVFFVIKKKKYVLSTFQNLTQSIKKCFSYGNFKQKKIALYFSKKTTKISKRNFYFIEVVIPSDDNKTL